MSRKVNCEGGVAFLSPNARNLVLSALFVVFGISMFAQNAVVGTGFSTGWGGGGCPTGNTNFKYLAASAGTSYIVTSTANGTGNQYWRYGVDWGGTTAQLTITSGTDVLVAPNVTYNLNTSCTTAGSLYYNVPNASYNYVFKTLNAGNAPTGQVVFFEVQGAVQSVSSVSQSPAAGSVNPSAPVTVTANLSGSLNTGQAVYLRYTNDGYATSTVVQMTGSGTTYTAPIPTSMHGQNKTVSYYVFTSGTANVAGNGSNADFYTINLNNNGGTNYSYTITNSPIVVTATGGTVGPTGYATLAAAVTAINAGTHTGAINISVCGATTEGTASIVLNASGSGSASYTSISLKPAGGAQTLTAATVAGSPFIDLNGADNVTIDGLNTGGNSLTIVNSTASATASTATIRLIADATNNIIQNCTIKGSGTGAAYSATLTTAVVLFSTGTTTGNDNNQVLNNNITSNGTAYATQLIASYGTSTAISNDNITISGNNLYDFFATTGMAAINVGSNSSAWTITSNKIYQVTSQTTLASGNYLKGIVILTTSGSGYAVNNNTIGYNSSAGTGMLTNSGGRFTGIEMSVAASPVSDVQGNTINNIAWTTASGAAALGTSPFNGMVVLAGGVNIGTTTGNTIGLASGVGSASQGIYVTTTTTGTGICAIYVTSTAACSISNNTISGFATGGATTVGYAFTGIAVAGSGNATVTSNNIGSATAGGITLGITSTTATCSFTGISMGTTGTTVSVNSNTIRNVANTSSGTGSFYYGINVTSAGTTTTTYTINSNTITGLTTLGTTACAGIFNASANTQNSMTISSNSITNLTAAAIGLYGIALGSPTTVTASSNTITGLTNTSGTIYGINLQNHTTCTMTNNVLGTFAINNTASTGSIYGVYSFVGALNVTFSNNTVSNFTTTATSSSVNLIGFRQFENVAGTKTIQNNTFSTFTGTGATIIYGLHLQSVATYDVSGNTISGLTLGATVAGIYSQAGNSANIYKNKIYNLSSSNAAGVVWGIQTSLTATVYNIYNNIIGDLSSTTYTSATAPYVAVANLNIPAAASGTVNVYNNTFYIGAVTSSGTNFSTANIFANTSTPLLLQNNLCVNLATAKGSGKAASYVRSSTTLTTYSTSSNKNSFYGTNGLFWDGTNNYTTLATYKTAMATRDQNALNENPTFASTTGSATNYLHISAGATTPLESGGVTVALFNTDFDGDSRPGPTGSVNGGGAAYDVGADEFDAITPMPVISFTSATPGLTTQCTKASRAIVVSVTNSGGATTTSVTLNYNHNGVAQTAVTMTNTSGNSWSGTMLAPATGNATVTWSISATNSAGYTTVYTGTSYADEPNSAISATAAASPTTLCVGASTTLTATPSSNLFTELFNGSPTAQFTIVNTVGTFTATQNSTYFAEGTSSVLFNTASTSADGQLTQTTAISLVGNASAKLTFNHICATEAGWDYGYVQYSTDGGTTWTSFPTTSYAGTGTLKNGVVSFDKSSYSDWGTTLSLSSSVPTNALWKSETINIPAALLTSTNFKIRFRYTTDTGTFYYGWLIDNVKITGVPNVSAYAWSDGSTTVATTNPATVAVPATTNYTCALTINSCPVTSSAATVTATALPTAPTTTNSNQCGSAVPTCSATGGSAGQYRWYTASSGGTAISGETNGTLSSYIVSSTTTLYVAINNGTCESTRTPVTITVASADVLTASASPTTIACLGSSTSLSVSQAGSTNTYALTWSLTSYTGSGLSGATAGSLVTPLTVTPTATGTYTYTITGVESGSGCQSVSSVSVTVNNPNAALTATATATPASVCTGSTTSLSMVVGGPGSGIVSSGLTASSLSSYSNPVYSNWANNRTQFLILGSELTASGFIAGNITALSFNLTSTSTTVRSSYTIKMGHTATTAMTTAAFLAPTFTTVFSNNFTPAVGTNTFTFTTPFTWDGSSNVVIEMCWDNTASTATESSTVSGQTTSFNSTISYNRTSTTGTSICGAANTPSTAYTTRPIFTLTGVRPQTPTAYSWSDGSTVIGTTNPLTYTVGASVTATGTATINACPITASTSVTAIPLPTAPTTTASSHCGTAVPTCSASGGSAGQYRWYTAASGGTAIAGETNGTLSTYTVSSTTTLYVAINNGTCESTRTPVVITVATADALTASVTPTGNICLGSTISLGAAQTGSTNTFALTWSLTSYTGSGLSGATAGSLVTPLSVTPTAAGTYTYTLTGVESSSGCQSSSSVNVTVINPNASYTATATATPSTLCLGDATSLAMNTYASGTVTLGAGGTTSTGYESPFYHFYGGVKSQYIVRASELTALGLTAGNITALKLNVVVGGTVFNTFAINMVATSNTDMSAGLFNGGMTTVYSAASVTPTAGLFNFTFSTPFNWNGTSNIIIQFCWSNNNTGGTASTVKFDTQAYVSGAYYRADSTPAATICAATTASGTISARPQFVFTGNTGSTPTAFSWSDGTSVIGSTNPLSYTPSASGTFTGTATVNGCPLTASTSVTVNPLPTTPTVSNSTQCGTGIPTCSATGGSAGQYRWYTAASGGTAIAGETNGTLSTYSVSASTTLYVSINNGTCESARVAVSITVTPPPSFTLTTDLATVCNNAVATLSVSSTLGDYTNYTWTPTTNLYTDASASTAYTSGSASTIYFKTATAGSYTLTGNASNSGTGCSNTATVTVFVQPASATVSSSTNNLCLSGSATLSATPATGYATGSLQWQSSSDNITFADVSGATAATLATGTISATTYYQLLVKNSAGATCLSPSVTVTVNNPVITGTTPVTRCGTGTATLQATANAGSTINWYAAATGGTSLGTGTSYTTPSLSTSTTYYAEARTAGAPFNGARLAPANNTGIISLSGTSYGLVFDVTSEMTLNSVDVYSGGAGNLVIQLQNSAGTPILTSSTFTIPTGTGIAPTTLALGWNIPVGTGYRLIASSGTCSLERETSGITYPIAVGSLASITSGYTTTTNTTNYYYFYNWNVTGYCTSARTAVTATVNAAPALTFATSSTTICNGSSSSALTLSSTASDFDTYTWTPSASVTGNSTSGWVFNPTSTTSYTLNASQSTGSQCVNSTTYTVNVNPSPSALTITSSAPSICVGGSIGMNVSGGTISTTGTFGTGTAVNTTSTYPGVYSAYYGGQKTQVLVLASELTAAGFTAGTPLTSLGMPVSSLGTGWGTTITSLQNFQISMGHTALGALTGFVTGLTQVRTPYSFTPVVGTASANTHAFTTNFTWNGTSNVVIEIAFSNNFAGTVATAVIQPYSTTAFNSYLNYRADNTAIASILSATTVSNGPNTSRPNFVLNGTILPTYTWSPSTGLNTTTGSTVSANPATTTTYTATATAPNTCTNTATVTVTVNPLPTPTFTASAGATTCLNTATTYTTQSGMTNYVWTFSGTSGTDYTLVSGGTSSSNTATITWLTQGSKTVTVGYTNGNGCVYATAASNTTTVVGVDWGNLQFPASATVCQGSNATAYGQVYEPGVTPGAGSQGAGITAQLGISSTNTNPNTWAAGAWTNANFNAFGGGANNDEYMLDFGASLAPGTYYYTFRYSLNGCAYQYGGYSVSGGGFWDGTNYVNGVLTVNPTYTPSVSLAADATTICTGTSVTFTATPTNGGSSPSYQWYLNGNPVGTGSTTYTNASLVNGDVVYVVMTANNTCQTSATATSTSITMTVTPLNSYYADADQDGYGDAATSTTACSAPLGYVSNNTDCDDTDSSVNPAASEVCNGIDDNCNSSVDDGLTFTTYYVDADGDGFGSTTSASFCQNPGAGYSLTNTDCDDASSAVYPGATEVCNSIDDDCNGLTDDAITYTNYYLDQDGDGFGAGTAVPFCSNPGSSYSLLNTDCNDGNAFVNPSATEVCNGIDDNCNGQIDEGVQSTFYADADGDGFGNAAATTMACTAPTGYVSNSLDCNDASAAINPNTLWYYDADGDSYYGSTTASCTSPGAGYTLSSAGFDCNDANAAVSPAATEVCNGVDDNCDGLVDNNAGNTYYADIDNDGYGNASSTVVACTQPAGYVSNSTDCNDSNALVNPAVTELCNFIDDNCNGTIDEGCNTTVPGEEPSNALAAPGTFFPTCMNFYGTLAGAIPSVYAQSYCLTGEDVWYSFNALSSAATIFIGSSMNDIVIELQDASGNLINVENAVSGIGTEIMNISGLTVGGTYKVGVRNFNSGTNAGAAFSACIRYFKRGNCDSGGAQWPSTANRCAIFKATYAGSSTGVQYRYTFTGTSGAATGNVYTRTQNSDYLVLTNLTPSAPDGCTYNVLVTNIFTIADGAGNNEVIEVSATSPCSFTISADPVTVLRTSDQCQNGPRFRGSIVASLPWVCGVTNWRWRFTEVHPITYVTVGIPIELNRGAASNFLNLGTVSQLQYGKTYAVQTAPILSYTSTNYNWGPVSYMCIIGSAGMVIDAEGHAQSEDAPKSFIVNEPSLGVYPNPVQDGETNLYISGLNDERLTVRCFDAMGKMVYHNTCFVAYGNQSVMALPADLAGGVYVVRVDGTDFHRSIRYVIEK